jgi:predicted nucleotide-binding protein (sugar kinase/HSP70/actin superfamily)
VRHEKLIAAALEGLGHKVGILPTPSRRDFQTGREYSDPGMCNPSYFTAGSLLNFLKRLRDVEGLPTERILRDYAYVTAGTCGPCRFGMYEAQLRLALRNAGFDGFRVLVFQQEEGLEQASADAGLEFNTMFFLSFLNAMFIGDILNEMAHAIRPYEVHSGQTERVFARIMARLEDCLRSKPHSPLRGGWAARLMKPILPCVGLQGLELLLDQLLSDHYVSAMRECARVIDSEIEVDFVRPRPICKVIGEFWAQTTEGDGNFSMFSFLESQGAEVLVEPITTWVSYMLAQMRSALMDMRALSFKASVAPKRGLLAWLSREMTYRTLRLRTALAGKTLCREYARLCRASGGLAHPQVNQIELQRLGHPYYNCKCSGGEGHLEVAKNIYYSQCGLANMVLSLKPFGCMPSTQSDGAQAAVMANYPELLFLPVETSGEGDIHAHSRVLMTLGEAKVKCKEEFKACLEKTGYSLEDLRRYGLEHRELRRPLLHIPRTPGIIGKAANFVLYVGSLMDAERGAKEASQGNLGFGVPQEKNHVHH